MAELGSPNARTQVDVAELRRLASEQLRAHAPEACRTLATLLERKAPREEAEGVKRWLVSVAQRTAEAAKEGGFLGSGDAQVTETETAAIREVAEALGVASPV